MNLNWRVCILSFAIVSFAAHAQDNRAVASRIVEGLSDATWKSTEAGMPTFLAGLQVQLRNAGATDSAARALTDEIRSGLTRNAVNQAFAEALEKQMSRDELLELERFFQSATGGKYLSFLASTSEKPVHLVPILRKACDSAGLRLAPFEKGSINGFCSRIEAM